MKTSRNLVLSLALMAVCFGGAASSAFSSATFENVLTKSDGRAGLLSSTSQNLVVARQDLEEIQLIAHTDSTQVRTIAKGKGFIDIQANRLGWIATCVDFGARVEVYHESKPGFKASIELETLTEIVSPDSGGHPGEPNGSFCGGVEIEMSKGSKLPLVWVSLPGDQAIVKLAVRRNGSLSLKRVFRSISGSFDLRVVGNYIFTTNVNVLLPYGSLPLVLDKGTGLAVIGSAIGEESATSLKREYYTKMIVDPMSRSVLYFNGATKSLLMIPFDRPDETKVKRVAVGMPLMKSALRFGQCIGVLAQSDDSLRQPLFSILKEDVTSKSGYTSVREILDLSDPVADWAPYFSSSDDGQFYLSSRAGIVKTMALFDGLDCI